MIASPTSESIRAAEVRAIESFEGQQDGPVWRVADNATDETLLESRALNGFDAFAIYRFNVEVGEPLDFNSVSVALAV